MARGSLTPQPTEPAALVAQWVATKTETQLRLADALEQSGDLMLDDPKRSDALASEIVALRARLEMADRAIPQAVHRHAASVRAGLLAAADALDGPLADARAEVASFDDRTDELVAALTDHTGGSWVRETATLTSSSLHVVDAPTVRTVAARKDGPLHARVFELTERQAELRAAAAVEAPAAPPPDLPMAQASVRLLEVTGELSEASAANVRAVCSSMTEAAEALEDERGALVWDLKQAWQLEWAGLYGHLTPSQAEPYRVPAGNLDDYLATDWQPTDEPAQTAQVKARELAAQQARLRADAALLAAAIAPRPAGAAA